MNGSISFDIERSSDIELDDSFGEELFEKYRQQRLFELKKKTVDRETFFVLLREYLQGYNDTENGCYYAVVGGMAYNAYISPKFDVPTTDWDITMFGKKHNFHRCVDRFISGLRQLIESKGYSTQNFDLSYREITGFYQLQLIDKKDMDMLDIGFLDRKVETQTIGGIRFATVAHLLDQLKTQKGLAAAFGLREKEIRRRSRETNLTRAIKDVVIFDRNVHKALCQNCVDRLSENFTGMHIRCDRIDKTCLEYR